VTVYYVVRAENDETCGGGPNNGGLMDGNLVYADAVDVTGQPPPGNVGDTLSVDDVNETDVRLDWTAVSDAVSYKVYRSTMADAGFAVVGEPTAPLHDDPGAFGDGQSYYYLVTAVNACGDESVD
jgi:fibronectin type 3 domain-containing protein